MESVTSSSEQQTEFRGLFGENGDSKEWLDAIAKFPNGVLGLKVKPSAWNS